MTRRGVMLPVFLLLGLCLALARFPAEAQGDVQPVNPSGNTIGEVTATGLPARFVVASMGSESVQVQIFGVSSGFLPRFRVTDATGTALLDVANPGGQNTVSGTAFFTNPGAYTIEVAGEQGTTGQFVLSLMPGAPPPPPIDLVVGQPVTGVVGPQTPVLIYQFVTTADGVTPLIVLSDLTTAGPALSLSDQTLGRVIATSDGALVGVTYYLSATNTLYRLEVQAGGAGSDIPFTLCFGCGSDAATAVTPPQQDAGILPGGACQATSSVGGAVNVRSGPGTQYLVIGGMPVGQLYPVTGQTNGGGWYQIDYNGVVAFVGSSVTRLEGDCASLPIVAAPASAPLAPTLVPTATLTPNVTATATGTSSGATATATATGTSTGLTATATATATPTEMNNPTATATATATVAPPATTEEP